MFFTGTLQAVALFPQTTLVSRSQRTEFFFIPVLGPSVTQTELKMARRGLMEQDLSRLDVATLHPLSPEVISRQATINIGMAYAVFSSNVLTFSSCACIDISIAVLVSAYKSST